MAQPIRAHQPQQEITPESELGRITWRSVGIGLGLAIAINLAIPYCTWIVHTSPMFFTHLPIGALLPYLLVLTLGNLILKTLGPAYPLSGAELLLIFALLLIGSTVPVNAFMSHLISVISTPYYFATPENRWRELLFPHLPSWLVAKNEGRAMEWFFEGLPAGQSILWGAWGVPLFWWGNFCLVLFFVGCCLMVILRKQWVEYEKLAFPLAQVVLEMAEGARDRRWLPRFMRSRMFWIGFALPLGVALWNVISYFVPGFEVIPLGSRYASSLVLGQSFPAITVKLNTYVLCFAFFTNLEVLFSIWVFHLLAILQTGLYNRIGLVSTGVAPNLLVATQMLAGFFFFVAWGLWMARRHLQTVLRKALGRAPEVDDRDEVFSYRLALFGFLLGILYLAFWLHLAGMSFAIMLLFFPMLFALYLGVNRVVAETGIVSLDLPRNSHEFLVPFVGSSSLSSSTLMAFGLTNVFSRNWRLFTMTAVSHILKIAEGVWLKKRRVFLILLGGWLVCLVTGAVVTIYMGYETVGAYHFGQWVFGTGNLLFYNEVVTWMTNPTEMTRIEMVFFASGVGITALLTLLRYHFPWWPLHPVGFVIARGVATDNAAFSIFLVWVVKSVLLRVGGARLYNRSKPLFLGILAGHALSVGIVALIDAIWFPGQGHVIHSF